MPFAPWLWRSAPDQILRGSAEPMRKGRRRSLGKHGGVHVQGQRSGEALALPPDNQSPAVLTRFRRARDLNTTQYGGVDAGLQTDRVRFRQHLGRLEGSLADQKRLVALFGEFTDLVPNGYFGDICEGDLSQSLADALALITVSCDNFPPEG